MVNISSVTVSVLVVEGLSPVEALLVVAETGGLLVDEDAPVNEGVPVPGVY